MSETKASNQEKVTRAKTTANRRPENEIDLLELAKYILKFWPILLLAMILGGGLMGGVRYLQPYTYTSSSMLYVVSSTTSIASVADIQIGTLLTDDYVVIIKSKPVLDKAVEEVNGELGTEITREDVQDSIRITNTADTRILSIKCTTPDAVLSKTICDAVTEAAAERMAEVTMTEPPTIVEYAEVAEKPNGRGVVNNTAKGMLGGLMLVGMVLCVLFLLNDKLHRSEDVRRYLNENVLGEIPYEKNLDHHRKLPIRKKKK